MIYQVIVTGLDGQKFTIDLCESEKDLQRITVQELKVKISAKISERLPGVTGKLLIFGNKRLDENDKRLHEYGIIHKSAIHMVISLDGGPAS
uniref:Ubiquitin-like domain-containing protein n=1 Tax=Nothobranchius furzeri TaxID=105023 RepID=A0A8C6NH41_NOTFU